MPLSWQAFDFYRGYVSGEARLLSSGIRSSFIKAVSDTVLDMINAAYHDKPLIFLEAIRLSLLRLLLTLYLT